MDTTVLKYTVFWKIMSVITVHASDYKQLCQLNNIHHQKVHVMCIYTMIKQVSNVCECRAYKEGVVGNIWNPVCHSILCGLKL